jgi:hypothetical protein
MNLTGFVRTTPREVLNTLLRKNMKYILVQESRTRDWLHIVRANIEAIDDKSAIAQINPIMKDWNPRAIYRMYKVEEVGEFQYSSKGLPYSRVS